MGSLAEQMVKGGFWADDRLQRAGKAESRQCCYCDCDHADLEHLLWERPRWEEARVAAGPEALLAQDARRTDRVGFCPMMWLRGIVPWRDAYGPLTLAEEAEVAVGRLPPPPGRSLD